MTEIFFYIEREEGRSPKIARMTSCRAMTPVGFVEGAMVRWELVMVGNNWNLPNSIAFLTDKNDTVIFEFDERVQEAAFRKGFRTNLLEALQDKKG